MTFEPASPAVATVEPLSYADEVEQFGVSSQRAPFGLRVVIPPLPSWRHLPRGYFVAVTVLALFAAFPLAEAIASRKFDVSFAIPAFEFGVPAILVAVYVWQLTRRRTAVDVTRDGLAISFVTPTGRASRMSWSRGELLEVRGSEVNGKLIVRCRGMDAKEVYIGPSRAVLQSVAAAVNEALAADLEPAPAGASFPPVWTTSPAPNVARLFLVIPFMIGVAAIVVLPFSSRAALVLMLVLVALLVPYFGITRGTQEKEFFT